MKLNLPNLLPNWISNRVTDPEGTAPKGLVFKGGTILLTLMMAAVIFLAPSEENGATEASVAPALPPPAGPAAVTKGDQDIQTASSPRRRSVERGRRKRETAERARQFEQNFLREQAELEAEAASNREAISASRQQNLTAEEELQQNLRLERIQREDLSFRSAPVALSFRTAESQARPCWSNPLRLLARRFTATTSARLLCSPPLSPRLRRPSVRSRKATSSPPPAALQAHAAGNASRAVSGSKPSSSPKFEATLPDRPSPEPPLHSGRATVNAS